METKSLEFTTADKNRLTIEEEDGGRAKIVELDGGIPEGVFVTINSWSDSDTPSHPELDALLKTGFRVIIEPLGEYIVRLWDGFDGVWIDISSPLSYSEAKKIWNQRTENGTRKTKFDDIDYYQIFPADTKMTFSEPRADE